MRFLNTLTCAALLTGSLAAQTITLTTPSGTVPRGPQPNLPTCSTAPEPYYFAITGTVTGSVPPGAEVRLIVSPRLLDGGPIFGCQWIKQCEPVVPDANGNFVAYGQFGTNDRARSWFSGAQAQVLVGVFSPSAPVCMSDPFQFSLAASPVITINTDPNIPNLFDFQIACSTNFMDVTGTPSPGQSVDFTLPQQGWMAFGALSTVGFLFQNCQVYFDTTTFPLEIFATDANGMLSLPLPNDPGIVGLDWNSQGIVLVNGAVDFTQPTLMQIR